MSWQPTPTSACLFNDWLNLGFVKIAGHKRFYLCERTKKNRYGRAVL